MNSHSEGELKPNLPEPLLAGLDPHRRWLYEQVSMQGQQNTEILRRLEAGNQRFDTINRALEQHFKDDAKQFGALNQNVNALVAQATVRRRVWRWVVGGRALRSSAASAKLMAS